MAQRHGGGILAVIGGHVRDNLHERNTRTMLAVVKAAFSKEPLSGEELLLLVERADELELYRVAC